MNTNIPIPGINIQFPWTRKILSRKKSIETRTYPLPKKYIGTELAIIETPGPWSDEALRPNQAQIVGTIIFGKPTQYCSLKEWLADQSKHQVKIDSPFSWSNRRGEVWAWPITKVRKFNTPKPAPKIKGIVFTSRCYV